MTYIMGLAGGSGSGKGTIDWYVPEIEDAEAVKKKLVKIARQRVSQIYEAVKAPLIQELDLADVSIAGLD